MEHDPSDPLRAFRDLLDGGRRESAAPDALREVLAHHSRWRTRWLGTALAVVVVAGPVGGYLWGHANGGSTSRVAAARAPSASGTASAPLAANNSGAAAVGVGPFSTGAIPKAKLMEVRTASDGTRIRYYLQPSPAVRPLQAMVGQCVVTGAPPGQPTAKPSPPLCTTAPVAQCPTAAPTAYPVEVEVSNDQVAGVAGGAYSTAEPTNPLDLAVAQVVGADGVNPIATVLARTRSDVASVRLALEGGGSDVATASAGHAVLAVGIGTLPIQNPAVNTPGPTPTPAPPSAPSPYDNKAAASPPVPAVAPPAVAFPIVGFAFPKATVTALDSAGNVLGTIDLPGQVNTGRLGMMVAPCGSPSGG